MFLMRYKLDVWSMEQGMSMHDMQSYIKILTARVEEENQKANQNSGNKLMKCLMAIRDILNFMFMKENPK